MQMPGFNEGETLSVALAALPLTLLGFTSCCTGGTDGATLAWGGRIFWQARVLRGTPWRCTARRTPAVARPWELK